MKEQVLQRLSGNIQNVHITYHEIENFFPFRDDKLIDELLTVAAEAWDSQTEVCVNCPTRCISEKDQKATMFEDPYYYK